MSRSRWWRHMPSKLFVTYLAVFFVDGYSHGEVIAAPLLSLAPAESAVTDFALL